VLRWNKAKMVKPKCEEGDPNCDDQPYCVLVGKVRSLIVRRDYRSGKRWDEKGSLSYTCKDRKLHGSLTHKIYWKDAGLRWTVKTKFSKGAEVGVRTTKDNGKHIVEARCFSTPYTRYSENDWRSDMLWKIKIPYPDPKSHSYEGAKDVLKADLALYKAGNKVVGLMSKGCSEFVPEHCEIKNKAGLRGVCRDAKWCAKHVGRCPGFKSE